MMDFNKMTKEELVVYVAIKDARIDNLKPRKDIEKSTGLTKRRIEKIIVRLRNEHNIPVFALKEYPQSGYYLATSSKMRVKSLVPAACSVPVLFSSICFLS